MIRITTCLAVFILLVTSHVSAMEAKTNKPSVELKQIHNGKQRNIIFILSDDHRYDALGFMGHPFLKTPRLDELAAKGVHFKNAFVTTSLCSPSRASILTGQFAHKHRVVDNNNLVKKGTVFFPQYLQQAGYQTAFVGKWHMGGHSDAPRPGFDHWVSFRGQGHYYPPKNPNWSLNVNGKSVKQKGYITDELTDYAVDWLSKERDESKPFFLYLSHKAVHGDFYPAQRHKGTYEDVKIPKPVTMPNTKENYHLKPRWVKDQRNSWHGVDFSYHNTEDALEQYRRYTETMLAVDESVGRLVDYLRKHNLEEDTLIIYMGDNGFLWGEHGLIDKRCAYEESMRVPMIGYAPGLFKPGTVVDGVVANIDIGPTFLEVAGLGTPDSMDGQSFLGLATGKTKLKDWRDFLLYEYYWEYNFPQTPSQFALRGNKYKFIQYHGIWDIDELYDLENDPKEQNNLIFSKEHQQIVRNLRKKLHDELEKRDANLVPFGHKRNMGNGLRLRSGAEPGNFPEQFMRTKDRNE